MKFIVLCGGSGDRMQGYSMPKPLNLIWSKPAIYYTLYNLPESVTNISFIISRHLDDYNFEPIVKNLFRKKQCSFYRLPYFTRGPVESALLGIQEIVKSDNLLDLEEPIVFMDNDVYYTFPIDFFAREYKNHFLGYCKDNTGSEAYSFLKFDSDVVIDIQEKRRISDNFCCGTYGFKSISSFIDISKKFLGSHHEQEYYMSYLFQMILSEKELIEGIQFIGAKHLGSLSEVENNIVSVPIPKLRICFDLDNTLVTYPNIVGDYKSVKPITKMIELAKYMHSLGHNIIIYTARRMETHKYNIGAVIKDIAKVTIDTLEEFNIPYDELIFGKPLADIYIDDRAINPYRNDFQSMGLLYQVAITEPINKLPNNKYNRVTMTNNEVIKTGPKAILEGELEFYKNIPKNSNCINMFPKLYDNSIKNDTITLRLEYIKGIPLYYLYRSELLTCDIISNLFIYMDILHHTTNETSKTPNVKQITDNYIDKLKKRFLNIDDYPFDKKEVYDTQQLCLKYISEYCNSDIIQKNICHIIHGDFWFSNIILEFKKNIKAIDMKGHLDGFITTGGDCYYDYAKLLQSFLGYDLALYGDQVDTKYSKTLLKIYKQECSNRNIDYNTIKNITFGLVMGTFHAIDSIEKKIRVWDWIIKTFI